MKLKDYKAKYDRAPYDLIDFAIGATEITDNKELMVAAFAYINAKVEFEHLLETHNIEVG